VGEPKIIRASEVQPFWDGNQVCAQVGPDLQGGNGGFGDTAEEALLDLVARLREGGETLWVPHWAKAYLENDTLKAQCPECGFVTTMSDWARVYAFVCENCGNGTRVDNSGLPPDFNPQIGPPGDDPEEPK
jgi:hypothetical protein